MAPQPIRPLLPSRPGVASEGVSVVVPCHYPSRYDQTCKTVLSALDQTSPPGQVVVVVDRNPALRERLAGGLPARVAIVDNRHGPGSGGSRNTGAQESTGEYTLFVDDDITLERGCLESLMRTMGEGLDDVAPTRICGVGSRKLPDWEESAPRWLPETMWWVIGVSYEGLPDKVAQVPNVWGDCMLVSTGGFLASGGFRSGFGKVDGRSRPDDTEFSLRYSAGTDKVWVYEPAALCTHHVPADRCRYRFFARRSFVQGVGVAGIRHLGLASERTYLSRSIPRAVWREGRRFAVSRDGLALVRVAVILTGLAFTAAGYLTGLATGGGRALFSGRPGRRGILPVCSHLRT